MAQPGPDTALIPVAIVVPILDEASTLPRLLNGIERQTLRPAELVFADSGSSDGSPEIIERWWREHAWPGGQCQVVINPGALPGGGRNLGIRRAQAEWIAFLDGGIEPQPDWLEQLWSYMQQHNVPAAFGMCRFLGEGAIPRAICALSSGYGTLAPVIPASLFRRRIFDEVGFFPENLRSAEDIMWVEQYLATYRERRICEKAIVVYSHYPETLGSAFRKWFVYAKNTFKARVRRRQQAAYSLAFALFIAMLLTSPAFGIAAFGVYIVIRGIADPIRRSAEWQWWKGSNASIGLAMILGPGLDAAKLAGFFAGAWQSLTTPRTSEKSL